METCKLLVNLSSGIMHEVYECVFGKDVSLSLMQLDKKIRNKLKKAKCVLIP